LATRGVVSRREQLLQVALALFSERGVDGASMRELARRAGVNVATAYHHFDSKRALLRAVFEELGSLDEIRARLEPEVVAFLRSAPAEDAIALVMQVSLGRMEQNAAYYGLLHAEVLRGDPDARTVSLEMWNGWGAQLEDVVSGAGLAEGDAGRVLAELLRALMWGLFNEWRLTGSVDETRRNERVRGAARIVASSLPR
jgi:AcrR family transcriptional regulator